MGAQKIGVATSIYKDCGFDSQKTIDFVRETGLSLVQLYMNEELEKDAAETERLRDLCSTEKITLLCHSPYDLNKAVLSHSRHIASLNRIFPRNQKKYVVFHFDETASVDDALSVMEILNNNGITVCLENYFRFHDRDSLVSNITLYTRLIHRAAELKRDFVPLIDIPRFFIAPFAVFDPLFICELVLNNIAYARKEIFLHLIDVTDTRQRREDWCPVGEGILSYDTIFTLLQRYAISVPYTILEYEEVEPALASLPEVSRLLNILHVE
ncbi:hypothetical protein [Chitinivibrio alkaliphilus]|uniref:Xylose isomerase-like TIM barrel domain-containing protein n=1 Tax=Chitinivibrio alkaliphilus ACht1 TaxID=1313304 RepID=U7DAD9_9BACT|nr:hypothetical protein [Chitinivibrio alkaliphilus]ERP38997.1 hypothetical protein CALK_0489 [Chitinivibrio alkaliphilus ACht1]